MIRDMTAEDGLPDYSLSLDGGDIIWVRPRAILAGQAPGQAQGEGPRLGAEVHDRVRAAAPGYDPYFLEAEWRRHWLASGRPPVRRPDAAFLAFARARARRMPLA